MTRRGTPEADLQRAVVQALRVALPRTAIIHHCANEVILHYRAEQGFTHPAPAITPHGLQPSHHAPISRPLWASMIASHGRVVSRRVLKARARRRLNPLFRHHVMAKAIGGWLMGWPIGHALCACSETEFTLWQQHMRGALSQLPMASGPWIWRPMDGPESPAQMNLFEGMLP